VRAFTPQVLKGGSVVRFIIHEAYSQPLHHYTHKSHVEQSLDSPSGDMYRALEKIEE